MALRGGHHQRNQPVFCLETCRQDERQIADCATKGNFEQLLILLNERGLVPLNCLKLCLLSWDARNIMTVKIAVSKINCLWMLFKHGVKIMRMPNSLRTLNVFQPTSPFAILIHAAGLELRGLDGELDTLEKCCRHKIRKMLRKKNRVNLFYRIPLLRLPNSIERFLLFDINLQSALYNYFKF